MKVSGDVVLCFGLELVESGIDLVGKSIQVVELGVCFLLEVLNADLALNRSAFEATQLLIDLHVSLVTLMLNVVQLGLEVRDVLEHLSLKLGYLGLEVGRQLSLHLSCVLLDFVQLLLHSEQPRVSPSLVLEEGAVGVHVPSELLFHGLSQGNGYVVPGERVVQSKGIVRAKVPSRVPQLHIVVGHY